MPSDIKQVLEALHDLTAEKLTARLDSEDCSAADINAAAKFLKDNDIEMRTRQVQDVANALDEKTIPFEIEDTGT